MVSNTLFLKEDHFQGQLTAAVKNPQGELVLDSGKIEGSYQSDVLTVPEFTDVVVSWNSSTPAGTFVEVLVRVGQDDVWSQWFSYGKWADAGRNTGSVKGQKDDIAAMAVDVVNVREGAANALQLKVVLTRPNPDADSPRVRMLAATWTAAQLEVDNYTSAEIALQVPPRAQLPIPEIGNIICSPTSLATVMSYHGYDEDTEQVAAGARDTGANIYGNWSYNIAYAGERGFTAYMQRCNSMEDVKGYLRQGLPVIASVRIKDKSELDGALSAYPGGHLLVITGLTTVDGKDYVLVNDPAANSAEGVARKYPREQFLRAWTEKRIYVLKK